MRDERTIILGSTHKHIGKTTLICQLIRQLRTDHEIVAVKLTPTDREEFSIIDTSQVSEQGGDTSKMRAAGAESVFWVKSPRDLIGRALESLYTKPEIIDADIIIIESTSSRFFLEPGLFILLGSDHSGGKLSAAELAQLADYQINTDTIDLESISIKNDTERFLLFFSLST